MMEEKLLTQAEVAKYLRVSTKTLKRWRDAGKGPKCFKIGNSLRYDRFLFEQWLKNEQR